MKKLIGIFDPKKMTPEQIYEKVKEHLDNQKSTHQKKPLENTDKSERT